MRKIYSILFLLALFTACKKENKINYERTTEKKNEGKEEIVRLGNLSVTKENGKYILGGDIVLSEAQVAMLSNYKPNQKTGNSTKSTFITNLALLWPNGIVYYTINNSVFNSQLINTAISEWENKTLITFIPRTTQANYVEFIPSTRNYSNFGMTGGRQTIELSNDADVGTATHEIGHLIGLMHEMSRPDRDEYISIDFSNTQATGHLAFQIVGTDAAELGAYDYESVMGYHSYAFPINPNLPTSTRIGGGLIDYIYDVSPGDIDAVNYLYDNANYKKIYVLQTVANIVDNSWHGPSIDQKIENYDIIVKFFEDANYHTPYALTKPVNVKINHVIGENQINSIGTSYVLVPIGVNSYKVGETHIDATYEWGTITIDNSVGVQVKKNVGYIGGAY